MGISWCVSECEWYPLPPLKIESMALHERISPLPPLLSSHHTDAVEQYCQEALHGLDSYTWNQLFLPTWDWDLPNDSSEHNLPLSLEMMGNKKVFEMFRQCSLHAIDLYSFQGMK